MIIFVFVAAFLFWTGVVCGFLGMYNGAAWSFFGCAAIAAAILIWERHT